jgi:hypothetical protein
LLLEGGLVMGLLAATAWLLWSLPLPAAERAAAWQTASGGTQLSGTVSPARLGANRIDVAFEAGALIEVSLLPVGGDGVVVRRTLTEASPGRFGSSGFVISRPGPWQMLVSVERPGQGLAYFTVDWEVRADGGLWRADEASTWPALVAGWLNTSGPALASTLAVVAVGVWGWRARHWLRLRR